MVVIVVFIGLLAAVLAVLLLRGVQRNKGLQTDDRSKVKLTEKLF